MQIDDYLYGLILEGGLPGIISNAGLQSLELTQKQKNIIARNLGLAEVILPPRSALVGRSLSESRFRDHYGGSVLGILRKGKPIVDDLIHAQLHFGDTLLIGGHWDQIRLLQEERSNFVVLDFPAEIQQVAPARPKAPLALFILLGMLLLMASKWVPSVTAVLIAGLAMVTTGCVRMKDAYSAINWESLVLIAGMLPMAEALEQSGGINLIVEGLVASLGDYGPYAVLAGLFMLTSLFSQFISNTATTDDCACCPDCCPYRISIAPVTLSVSNDGRHFSFDSVFNAGCLSGEHAGSRPWRIWFCRFCQGWHPAADSDFGDYIKCRNSLFSALNYLVNHRGGVIRN
jgi:hypothetical protein